MKNLSAADVTIRDVNLFYGDNHVLKNVNLDIRAGEFFAFLGPSGCGKTTLLRLIAGFNRAQSGTVRVGGEDIGDLPPWKRDIGMVFQSYALWPHLNVAANVAFGLEERRRPRDEINKRVADALDLVGMKTFSERMPSQLSGGQQQRVAVARTLAIAPKVLLLDEPLSNLDAQMRLQVRRELRELQRRLGLTTIFVTHDQEEANSICDRIAVMKDGIIQQVGDPMTVYEKPENLFVASFLGTANILEGKRENGGFQTGGISIPVSSNEDIPSGAKLVFRPQHVSVNESDADGLPAQVKHVEFLGSMIRYELAFGTSHVIAEAPFTSGSKLREAGERVSIRLAPEGLRWLAA
jgi:iron(III) transport system ATP-binding protein